MHGSGTADFPLLRAKWWECRRGGDEEWLVKNTIKNNSLLQQISISFNIVGSENTQFAWWIPRMPIGQKPGEKSKGIERNNQVSVKKWALEIRVHWNSIGVYIEIYTQSVACIIHISMVVQFSYMAVSQSKAAHTASSSHDIWIP